MSTATNPITGDLIKTKGSNDAYRDGWERIFGDKKKQEEKPLDLTQQKNMESPNDGKSR